MAKDDDIAGRGLLAYPPYLMNRITHRYNHSLQKAVAQKGLTVPKMRALAALAAMGELTINDLTVYAVAEQSTMSRTLDQMEKDGLITRAVSGEDNRARVVSLTKAGRAAHQQIWPTVQAAESAMFEGIDAEEKEEFLRTLSRIMANIRVHPF